MIKETTKKIHFEVYRPTKGRAQDTDPAPTVAVSRKYNNIRFSKKCLDALDMEGKFVRLYTAPSKKIIGWQLRDKVEQQEMKDWKLCNPNKTTGQWGVNIKKMLDSFPGVPLTQDVYSGLPVQKYREMGLSPFGDGIFYFVELSDGMVKNDKQDE